MTPKKPQFDDFQIQFIHNKCKRTSILRSIPISNDVVHTMDWRVLDVSKQILPGP